MKSLLRIALGLSFAVLPGGRAVAQQAVAPPPQPVNNGPSLAVTMQFIQEKLSELGTVNYAGYNHDNTTGQDWTTQFSTVDTNVVADPATCRISYHEKRIKDGGVTSDADFWFSLHDLQEAVTEPREQLLKKVNTAAGHPTWDARIDPPVTMLVARKADNSEWYFYFFDANMAGRVATAMTHGIELCGGGKSEPF